MANRYDCVIFDMDGTVMDTSCGVMRSVQYALREMGLPDDDLERIRKFIGPPLYEAFSEYYGMNDADATEAVRLYRVRYADIGVLEYTPYDGMIDLIRDIKAAGMKVGVATGKPEKFTSIILKHSGLEQYVDMLVTPNLSDKKQDKPEMIRAIMDKLGEKAIMVGDRCFDIEGAVANGIDSVGVTQGFGSYEELKAAGATQIVEGAKELRGILGLDSRKGLFITFEGTDGTGKTTQINLLKEYLEKMGESILVTREPGGTPIAEKIRELLLDKNSVMDDMTEAYLYAAARADHVRRVILPAIQAGRIVLCDRYLDSSVAYQGYGRNLGADKVRAINAAAVEDCQPDRTYLFVLSPEDAEKRVKNRGEKDRMESAGTSFANDVMIGFLNIALEEEQRVRAVDAGQTVERIAEALRQDVANLKTVAR